MPRTAAKTTKADETAEHKPRKSRARKGASPETEVRLTGDRLVVRVPDNGERRSAGGLLIPATAMPAPKRLTWAEVQLVGPDVRVAKRGDRVLFLPSSGLEVELDEEDLVLLRERDVQAVASPPSGKAEHSGQYL